MEVQIAYRRFTSFSSFNFSMIDAMRNNVIGLSIGLVKKLTNIGKWPDADNDSVYLTFS